ncbi:hypothetical protein ABZ330_03500 [Streptomyces sp. NPDC006172]|uniref:hypothetical protein n=1 Tax=Streptomyces sp. NPDC006172 TaxID=3154470 RepID=UPI0033DECADE
MITSPVDRLFPPRRPEPAPGCAVCADLDRERAAALEERDLSRVSDCNVDLRRHDSHRGASSG